MVVQPSDQSGQAEAGAPAPRAGTFEWDRLTGKVTWSSALERMHGLPPGAFAGTFEAFIADAHPDDHERVLASIAEALQRPGQPFRIDYRIVRPDGTVRWVEAHGEVLQAAGTEVLGIRGVCMDVSSERAQGLLREAANAVNRALAQASDLDTGLELVTQALGESLGGELSACWMIDNATHALRLRALWERQPDLMGPLVEQSRRMTLARGEGLPGRAWHENRPVWIEDIVEGEDFSRRPAALAAGIRSAFAFPIRDGSGLVGVVEWFGQTSFGADRAIPDVLEVIATETGEFVRRLAAETRARARERQQAAVARLGRLALEGSPLQALFDEAVALLADTLELEFAKVHRLLPGGEELLLVAGVGWQDGLVGRATVSTGADSQAGYTLETGGPVIVRDLRTEPRFKGPPLLTEHGVIAGMSTVIRNRDGTWGVLGVHTARERSFTEDDTAFLESVANVLATAVERHHTDRAQAFLLEASETLFASLDHRETLRKVAQLAVAQVADWCVIHLVGDGAVHVFETAHRDPSRAELVQRYRERLADQQPSAVVMHAIETGRPLLVADVDRRMIERAGLSDELAQLLSELDIRSMITAPLAARDRALGAITLISAESRQRYTASDVTVAVELARRAALAIDNARLYEQTREALRTREDFVSLASHELRSPLTTLVGFSALLQRRTRRGEFDEATAEALTAIDSEAHRMRDTLTLFLDMAMLDTDRFTSEIEEIDLVELVAREVASVQRQRPDVEVDTRWPPEGVPVRSDPTRIQTIVANLMSNALKYSGEPPRLVVSVEAAGGAGAIRVRDNGRGIASEDRAHVFERYYRGERVRAARQQGLGLGLYISKQVADRLGASLRFETEEGAGTEFVLELPASPAETSDHTAAE